MRQGPHRQRGWASLVVLLLALVIGGLVLRSMLNTAKPAPAPAEEAGASGALQADRSGTALPAADPIAKARAVEGELLRRAQEAQRQVDASDK